MQQSSATQSLHLSFWGLRKIVAYSHSSSQCLLVPTVFGTVSSLHPTSFLYLTTPRCSFRSVVIDCGPISFLDATGVKALKQLVIDFDKCNVQVLFSHGWYRHVYKSCMPITECERCPLFIVQRFHSYLI